MEAQERGNEMRVLLLVMVMSLFGCAGTKPCPSKWLTKASIEAIKTANEDTTRLWVVERMTQVDMHCGHFPTEAEQAAKANKK